MIGPATPGDLGAIASLEQHFPARRWSEHAWAEELSGDRSLVLVGRDAEGTVLGVAAFSAVADVADLNRVVVAPDHRRAGIGRRLVLAGLEWAEQVGARRVLLEVEVANEPARRLYEDLGFAVLSRRAGYYGPGVDAVVMERVWEGPGDE